MPVTYEGLLGVKLAEKQYNYTDREVMLYAVGIGMGADPMNRDELPFVYEKDLKVMPSLMTVVVWDDAWAYESGLDYANILHGEHRIRLHKPLPTTANLRSNVRIREAYDKGADKGAVVLVETQITDADANEPLCTMESIGFARADGGFGGPQGSPEPLPPVPERAADATVTYKTLPNQALIYRLSGDRNPLHCDPDAAADAGFAQPILHGLCSWGHACRAVVTTCCDYQPATITSFAARFTAPVMPGESLATEMWRAGATVHFRTTIVERDIIALDRGVATLKE